MVFAGLASAHLKTGIVNNGFKCSYSGPASEQLCSEGHTAATVAIAHKEPMTIKISCYSNLAETLKTIKSGLKVPGFADIVFDDDGSQLDPSSFFKASLAYCTTGKHCIPVDDVQYDVDKGMAKLELGLTIIGGEGARQNHIKCFSYCL